MSFGGTQKAKAGLSHSKFLTLSLFFILNSTQLTAILGVLRKRCCPLESKVIKC